MAGALPICDCGIAHPLPALAALPADVSAIKETRSNADRAKSREDCSREDCPCGQPRAGDAGAAVQCVRIRKGPLMAARNELRRTSGLILQVVWRQGGPS